MKHRLLSVGAGLVLSLLTLAITLPLCWFGASAQTVLSNGRGKKKHPPVAGTPTPGGNIFQEASGQVVMEAEHATWRVARTGQSWDDATATAGFVGAGYAVVADAGITRQNAGDNARYHRDAPELSFSVNFSATGTYYVWVRGWADSASADRYHAGIDGSPKFTADRATLPSTGAWVWNTANSDSAQSTLPVSSTGVHTVNIWMGEDGLKVDRVLLTTTAPGSFTPSGDGPAESTRSAGADSTAPTITVNQATATGHSTAYITWKTSEVATSIVEYGPTTGYGSAVSNSRLQTKHFLSLEDLPSGEIHYRIKAKDPTGNEVVSNDQIFRTSPINHEPERPRTSVDTDRVVAYSTLTGVRRWVGSIADPLGTAVASYTAAQLQNAFNDANPGDLIELQAGITPTANHTIARKTQAGAPKYIVVRTYGQVGMPAEGARIIPATHAGAMAKILTSNAEPALATVQPAPDDNVAVADGAAYWRFENIEFAATSTGVDNFAVVRLGHDEVNMTRINQMPHHIFFDQVYVHGQDATNVCYFRGFIFNARQSGLVDSWVSNFHGIGCETQAVVITNCDGPQAFFNNYLEGGTQSIMWGGADPMPYVASNPMVISQDVEFIGNHCRKRIEWGLNTWPVDYSLKNIFEIKSGERFLVKNCIFEVDFGPDQFFAIALTPRNQYGGADWTVVQDILFENTILRHASSGINILGHDDNWPSRPTQRIKFKNLLAYDISTVYHEDYPSQQTLGIFCQLGGGTVETAPISVVFDHLTEVHDGNKAFGPNEDFSGFNGTGKTQIPYFRVTNSILVHNDYGVLGSGTGDGDSSFAAYMPNVAFNHNVLADVAGNAVVTSSWDGPGVTGNFFPTSFATIDWEGQAANDFRLKATSPYITAASDGTMIGADVAAINAATAGVDPVAPVISSVNKSVAGSTVTFTCVTDEHSTTRVEYRLQGAGAWTQSPVDLAKVYNHSKDVSGLAAGDYDYRMVCVDESGNSATSAASTFTVSSSPTIARSPTSLTFNATTGGGNPSTQNVSITNSGAGTLNWTASDDAAWMSVTASGTAPSTMTVTVTTGALTAGTYTGTITIAATGATNTPQTVGVTFNVLPAPVLQDNFDDNSRDTLLWNVNSFLNFNSSVTVAEASGQLRITPLAADATAAHNGYESVSSFNFTNKALTVELAEAPGTNHEAWLVAVLDASNYVRIHVVGGGSIFNRVRTGGSNNNQTFTTYSFSTHRWLRISHSSASSEWIFSYSSDGNTFTEMRRVTSTGWAITSLKVYLLAGSAASIATPVSVKFDNATLQ